MYMNVFFFPNWMFQKISDDFDPEVLSLVDFGQTV